MRRSFTLVEVLIGALILALVIGAVSAIEASHIKTSTQGKRQLEALGLAQQGLNLSKSINDSNKLDQANPGLPDPGTSEKNYQLSTINPPTLTEVMDVPAIGICKDLGKKGVEIDLGNGRKYCREIIIEHHLLTTSTGDLRVIVSWKDENGNPQVELSTLFTGAAGGADVPTSGITILRPNGEIDVDFFSYPPTTLKWECVNEETANDDQNYIKYGTAGLARPSTAYAIFTVPQHWLAGKIIDSVTVHHRSRGLSNSMRFIPVLQVAGTTFYSTGNLIGISYEEHAYTWTKNPKTNNNWTPADLDNAYPGVYISSGMTGEEALRTTQIWMEIAWHTT